MTGAGTVILHDCRTCLSKFIRRKTFEVLHYLVGHSPQLITKAVLLDAIWANAAVSDSLPAICVGELHRALGDKTKPYRFIETIPGRGYRFVAQVTSAPRSFVPTSTPSRAPMPVMVGRDDEPAHLRSWYSRVRNGERRIVFVGGETGIGKTTFVRAFPDTLTREGVPRIARGQCVEQRGEGEPYMPVLEALTRLCRERDGELVLKILRQLAPTWLAQMPALLNEAKDFARESPRQALSRHGMLLEMAQALEELARASPLVLFIEDLHWSDFSTLELIHTLSRRSEAARLLVIGTHRSLEMLAAAHPLRNIHEELRIHRQCEELQLKLLSLNDGAAYLATRFAGQSSLDRLALAVHSRTDGNPLFFVNLVDYLLALEGLDPDRRAPELAGLLEAGRIEVPRTIRQMIERALERLSAEEQAVLEAASVAGAAFPRRRLLPQSGCRLT
jgi:predicted ATPase